MFPLIETAAAFAAVMLVTSLFVSAVVQVIQSLLGLRPQILGGMLVTALRGYRDRAGLSAPTDQEEQAFVEAILGNPLLHTATAVAAAKKGKATLSRTIDYLHMDDLVALVRRSFEDGAPATGPVRDVVTDLRKFEDFIARWYGTIGATASEHFKRRMRHITTVVSCLVVLGFNVDGIHLIGDLYRDQAARTTLRVEADDIRKTAARLGQIPAEEGTAARREADVQALTAELAKTAAILDQPAAGIGWQDSWILKRWRASPPVPPVRLAADVALWIAGLVFSCVMLSLGAPFWATTLGRLVNLGNAVQKWKGGGAKSGSGKGDE